MLVRSVRLLHSILLAACLAVPAGARAQVSERLLPGTRHFRHPLADLMAPRFGLGLLATDLLRTRGPERLPFELRDSADAAHDVQAIAGLGGTLPLLRLAGRPDGGVVVALEAAAFARFRIEYPSRDDLGTDWFVGLPVEFRRDVWSGRAAIVHRSSHLGDEFLLDSGAERIEFGHESLELMAARTFGATRVYGGGAWIFRSNTAWEMRRRGLGEHDRAELQAGAEHGWTLGPMGEAFAAIDVQSAERSDWRTSLSLAGGAGITRDGRAIRVLVRFHDGLSPLGEFFLTDERFFALELVVVP